MNKLTTARREGGAGGARGAPAGHAAGAPRPKTEGRGRPPGTSQRPSGHPERRVRLGGGGWGPMSNFCPPKSWSLDSRSWTVEVGQNGQKRVDRKKNDFWHSMRARRSVAVINHISGWFGARSCTTACIRPARRSLWQGVWDGHAPKSSRFSYDRQKSIRDIFLPPL